MAAEPQAAVARLVASCGQPHFRATLPHTTFDNLVDTSVPLLEDDVGFSLHEEGFVVSIIFCR